MFSNSFRSHVQIPPPEVVVTDTAETSIEKIEITKSSHQEITQTTTIETTVTKNTESSAAIQVC